MTKRKAAVSQKNQFVAGFIIPTVILLTLSDESKLGPLYGMLLSLAFPVAIELYSVFTGRKASYISLFAIIGILLIGAISLFGLSEEWLAARRAAIYIMGGIAVLAIARFKYDILIRGLGYILDTPKVLVAAKTRGSSRELKRSIKGASYIFGAGLLLIGTWSYVFTLIFMTAGAGTSEFNAEYAELRILSLPLITLPFMVLVVGLLTFLLMRIEKLTGLGSEDLLKKK